MSFDKKLLLPIEHKKTIVVGKSGTSGIVNYLMSANGSVLSMGVPEEWAKYIVEKVNSKEWMAETAEKSSKLLWAITIPAECPSEWKGQEFTIDEAGNVQKKYHFRFGRLLQSLRHNMSKWRIYKRENVSFPYYHHVHCIAQIYITDGNAGTLPRFCAVIEKLLVESRVLIRSKDDPCIKSFDGSRVHRVENGEAKIEIVLREYVG